MTEQLIFDYRLAGLGTEDRALCDFAVKLSQTPGGMGKGDVTGLKGLGFSETAITIATQVIAYFNYINRIADGLGVDPEEWMELDVDEWRSRKAGDYFD